MGIITYNITTATEIAKPSLFLASSWMGVWLSDPTYLSTYNFEYLKLNISFSIRYHTSFLLTRYLPLLPHIKQTGLPIVKVDN